MAILNYSIYIKGTVLFKETASSVKEHFWRKGIEHIELVRSECFDRLEIHSNPNIGEG